MERSLTMEVPLPLRQGRRLHDPTRIAAHLPVGLTYLIYGLAMQPTRPCLGSEEATGQTSVIPRRHTLVYSSTHLFQEHTPQDPPQKTNKSSGVQENAFLGWHRAVHVCARVWLAGKLQCWVAPTRREIRADQPPSPTQPHSQIRRCVLGGLSVKGGDCLFGKFCWRGWVYQFQDSGRIGGGYQWRGGRIAPRQPLSLLFTCISF